MRVRLLGSVDVVVNGVARPVPGLRRKAVLAVLAMPAGQIVGNDRLIELIWGKRATAVAPNTLQRHVSYLRGALDRRAAIRAQSPGYVLDIPEGSTDVAVAEDLIRRALRATDHYHAVAHFQAALSLWHGPALADVTAVAWLAEQAARLEQVRLVAVRGLVEARLALGEHASLVPELEVLAKEHRFNEHIHRQLMLALYLSGRRGDALATYRRLRGALEDHLGIDPSPNLRDLECSIRRHDPNLQQWPRAYGYRYCWTTPAM